jgi:spermidine synthase
MESPPADTGTPPRLMRLRLGVAVVTGGAASLVTEICASRLVAPYFGDSVLVWANIIGIILAALSVGYWFGGRVADTWPHPRALGLLMLAAAAMVAALPLVARPVLSATVSSLGTGGGVAQSSFTAVLVLFSLPTLLLGMVSPWALRIAISTVASSGAVAGRLYALSTLGSLAGTFGSALLAIPLLGTQRTLLGMAALLALAAVPLVGARVAPAALVVAALLLLPQAAIRPVPGLLHEEETQYQYLQVVRASDGAHRLVLNDPGGVQSMWYPDSVLTGQEWDFGLVAPPMVGHAVDRVLVLGNAGGTAARSYGAFYPQARIDGVELDPAVTAAGRAYLGVNDNPRLQVHTGDARVFLETSTTRYDVIILDCYHSLRIPFHLATAEFFKLAREHLTPGGVMVINVADVRADHAVFAAVGGTVATAFPSAFAWRPLAYNEAVIAVNGPATVASLSSALLALDPRLRSLHDLFSSQAVALKPSQQPLTDDRAPVEWLTDLATLDPGQREGFPASLPTAPR